MKRLLFFFLLLFPLLLWAQEEDLPAPAKNEIAPATAIDLQVGRAEYKGEIVPHVIMPTFHKYPPLEFKNEKQRERYNRLVANVKRVLPLAKLARITIIETHDYLQTLPTKEEREAHIRAMERDLKKHYSPIVSRMSRSQGRLLIKLIDRECNQTGFQIAQAFIGVLQANLYQAFSFLFGLNLNKRYDPEGDDRLTERVVRMVESGQL
ncbi:MAG: DUF4294 domain-containing protein [Bacteroidales bacterium]|nr:DUF4294 domain-containing protein [Bacteroidales bacterium]